MAQMPNTAGNKEYAHKQFTLRTEVIGQGEVVPNMVRILGDQMVDFKFIPAEGWKVLNVSVRAKGDVVGSSDDSILPRDNIYSKLYPENGYHWSVQPFRSSYISLANGELEHIIRVTFVPIGTPPEVYTGPTLDELVELTKLKEQVAGIEARLTKAGL